MLRRRPSKSSGPPLGVMQPTPQLQVTLVARPRFEPAGALRQVSGGRTLWAHLKFTPNIQLTIRRKEIEEPRVVGEFRDSVLALTA